ncbi:MAG: YgaP-like transmembrane domain [Acidimicrobiales bacterium]
MALVRFMGTRAGRATRVVAGLVLIGLGSWLQGGWWALAGIGLVPLAAGLANVCLLGPLFHAPVRSTTNQA